jgi:hypothetical protein
MYLMDSIIEISHEIKQRIFEYPNSDAILGIFPVLEQKLKGCPRFLFDENAIHTAVELTLGRPKVLREAMAHLTIPYPKMWIEWPESGREKLRQTLTVDSIEMPNRPLPKRLGFLIETENGRSGVVTWAWDNHNIGKDVAPNICPISAFFNLDSNFGESSKSYISSFLDANLARIWKDNPIQLNSLMSIWNTSVHKPSDWGEKFLATASIYPFQSKVERIDNFYADVYGEYIMVWSCLMLLTSSKKIVDFNQIDMSKLNKARKSVNKAPKLDHTIVSIHIGEGTQTINQQGTPLGFARKSPRVHLVCSYLARRGNKHWVVQPYWRGSGEIISRHVKVKI